MKRLLLLVSFAAILLTVKINNVLAMPLPPTPSQETLDQLREMGRQNELMYGTGTVEQVQPTAYPTATPTQIPTPTPTRIIKPTAVPTPKEIQRQIFQQIIVGFRSWWERVASRLIGAFTS